MPIGRVVIIPFLQGKFDASGKLIEPDIDAILEKWFGRHPQFRNHESEFHIIRSKLNLGEGTVTKLVRVTADFSSDLAAYDPAQDVDLYEEFVADDHTGPARAPQKIWIEQCEAAEQIECDLGTQKALDYLVGEKFLNFVEAGDNDATFRGEIPAFVARIKQLFETWQLAAYLEVARQSEPFDANLFAEDGEYTPEDIEDMRRDDIRRCTRDLLLVERARDWLLE